MNQPSIDPEKASIDVSPRFILWDADGNEIPSEAQMQEDGTLLFRIKEGEPWKKVVGWEMIEGDLRGT